MAAILFALVLAGEVQEAAVLEYAEVSKKERQHRIESIDREIERLESRKRRDVLAEYKAAKWTFPHQKPSASQYVKREAEERAGAISRLELLISELRDKNRPYYAERYPEAVGQLGRLSGGVKVLQILGKSRCLIEFDGREYVLKNVATNEWRDGQYVPPAGVFYISGNETYDLTSGGTNTVFVVEPADMANWESRFTLPLASR
jgi:hypothetical protein